MRIARVQIDEFAKPTVALVCDGAYYDVDILESRWNWTGRFGPADFHARVVGARCAGLDQLEMRLRSGDRPTEARLLPGEFLPLPPCDPDRAAYLQLAPYDHPGQEPSYQLRDSRALVGHDQPVTFPPDAERLAVEVGMAALLSEDLWRADAREAARAIAGFSLVLDWTAHPDRWQTGARAPDAPSQLGAEMVVRVAARDLATRAAELCIGEERSVLRVGEWRFDPVEALAFLSQHQPLRAGDVVGLGCLPGGRAELTWGQPASLSVERTTTLRGWAVPGREPVDWRLRA